MNNRKINSSKRYRKTPEALRRDKKHTKELFLDGVGEILRTEGFASLGPNLISRKAQRDKKLIYNLFNDSNGLLEKFLLDRDCRFRFASHLQKTEGSQNLKVQFATSLKDHFTEFRESVEIQQVVLWELLQPNGLLSSMSRAREVMTSNFFETADTYFERSKVNFRAIAAILQGGMYFLTLYARTSESHSFCGINIKAEDGFRELKRAMTQIIDWAFSEADLSDSDDYQIVSSH